jgi:hypothetical protein
MMFVRNRIDGTAQRAVLNMRKSLNGCHQFVLIVHERAGRRVALDRLSASIGYELIECAPSDLAALMLAGFRLPRSGHDHARLSRLVGIMRGERKSDARVTWPGAGLDRQEPSECTDPASWYVIVNRKARASEAGTPCGMGALTSRQRRDCQVSTRRSRSAPAHK